MLASNLTIPKPRRQIARLASGHLVFEPRVSISPCLNYELKVVWGIRINGQLAGRLVYATRDGALKAARKIARHLASGVSEPCDAF